MNEEEQKAVEELEEFIKGPCETCKYCEAAYKLNRKNIIQLLNLTKKLQKENEELKNKLSLKQFDINVVYNDYLEKLNKYKENSIPIQKIKDKIEELNNISNAEKLEDIMIGGNYTITELVQYVLQELIEERDKQIDLMSEQLTTPIHSKE